jgi:hypothetical protein
MFMKHVGLSQVALVSASDFTDLWAPRGWVSASQAEADAYFGTAPTDRTPLTKTDADGSYGTLTGLLAGRPAAAAGTCKYYFATDDNGGTLYETNGAAWLQVAAAVGSVAGIELATAALGSPVPGLTAAARTDIPGLSVTFTLAAARTVYLELVLPLVTMTTTSGIGYFLPLISDSANVALSVGVWTSTTPAGGEYGTINIRGRAPLAAGTYTYKVRYTVGGTGASATIMQTADYLPRLTAFGA